MMAQHIALEHPQRVRRLVLGCTTAGGMRHVLPPMENMAKFIAASEIIDPIAAVRSTYALNYSDEYIASHDAAIVERSLANAELRSTPEGRATQIAAVQAHDTHARLREIACPTFVAHGRTTARCQSRTAACSPPASRRPIQALSRRAALFFTECAEELNADIVAFLREGEAPAK